MDNPQVVFEQRGNNYYVVLSIHEVIEHLESAGAKEEMQVKIDVIYPSK